jgi:outer membrane immunogenic protein
VAIGNSLRATSWGWFGGLVMKKLLLVGACVAAWVGSAAAADMALLKAPAAPPPAVSWTGCYGGINGGGVGATSKDTWTNIGPNFAAGASVVLPAAANGTVSDGYFIVGGQLGCNYQTGFVVWGAVGDINYTGLKTTFTTTSLGNTNGGPPTIVPGNISETFDSRWLSTIRGRLGLPYGNTVMFYGTGGVAIANVGFSDQLCFPTAGVPTCNTASSSSTRVGYAAGGGIEFIIAPKWTVNAEYLFVNLGSVSNSSAAVITATGAAIPGTNITFNRNFREDIGRVGINYRF